jgi:hypothetical protein
MGKTPTITMDRSEALNSTSVLVGNGVVTGNGGSVIPDGSTRPFDVEG